MFTQNDPPTDAELDRLGDFLKGCKGGRAMNLEKLDGFFAALIAGPEAVMPSEHCGEVFGGEMPDTCEFASLDQANEILGLMMRHWNTIAGTLLNGDVYVPLLLEDKNGRTQGNGLGARLHPRHGHATPDWRRFVASSEGPRCGRKCRNGYPSEGLRKTVRKKKR